jgi:hypothetical protein
VYQQFDCDPLQEVRYGIFYPWLCDGTQKVLEHFRYMGEECPTCTDGKYLQGIHKTIGFTVGQTHSNHPGFTIYYTTEQTLG